MISSLGRHYVVRTQNVRTDRHWRAMLSPIGVFKLSVGEVWDVLGEELPHEIILKGNYSARIGHVSQFMRVDSDRVSPLLRDADKPSIWIVLRAND